jgi:hypothetical protein
VIGGGKFGNGAVTAAFGYLFNYLQNLDGVPIKNNPNAVPVLPYVDDSIYDRVVGFIGELNAAGVPIAVTDAFRTNGMQALLTGNQYGGVSYGTSLHEAGYAIDVNWNDLTNAQRALTLQMADKYGMSWGGGFRPTDPVHFFVDPFNSMGDRKAAIKGTQKEFMEGR